MKHTDPSDYRYRRKGHFASLLPDVSSESDPGDGGDPWPYGFDCDPDPSDDDDDSSDDGQGVRALIRKTRLKLTQDSSIKFPPWPDPNSGDMK